MVSLPQGMYFEEFKVGDIFTSAGRTITEGDIGRFAGISGDYNLIHTDAEFAEDTVFGERIAHGLLILSITSGLAARIGFAESTTIAIRRLEWKFIMPVKIGDTITGTFKVSRLKDIPGKEEGLVIFSVQVKNQLQQVVQKGKWTMIIKKKS